MEQPYLFTFYDTSGSLHQYTIIKGNVSLVPIPRKAKMINAREGNSRHQQADFYAHILSLVNFHIKVICGQHTFSLVIETESCINAVSGKELNKLGFKFEPHHPNVDYVSWITNKKLKIHGIHHWHDVWYGEQPLKISIQTCLLSHVVRTCGSSAIPKWKHSVEYNFY
jgi:hypothetical protein